MQEQRPSVGAGSGGNDDDLDVNSHETGSWHIQPDGLPDTNLPDCSKARETSETTGDQPGWYDRVFISWQF
jgi:hypothetical protein